MRSHTELTAIEQALTSIEAFGETDEGDGLQTLVQRLERLQAQMDTLNGVLKEMVEGRFCLPRKRPSYGRRISPAAEQARFRQQAKKLARYAPS